MNKVQLIGNLTRDVDLRTTTSGLNVARFTIAVPRRSKKDGAKEADFIQIIAWRQLADLAGKYLHKGSKVGVTGAIQTSNYTDKNGNKVYSTDVLADSIEFLTPKGTEPASRESATAEALKDAADAGFTEVVDDDLPF